MWFAANRHFGHMNPANRRHLFLGIRRQYGALFVWLAFYASLSGAVAGVGEAATPVVSAKTQERVAELIQNVLGTYRTESALTNDPFNSATVTYTNIEANFREASRLMPNRLDLRFGIASALLGQATQTNAPFEARMKSALKVYQEIHALDTNGFQAALLYATYTRALGETNASESTLAELMAVHPQRTRAYQEKFRRLDKILQLTPQEKPSKTMSLGRDHAIVVLGAGLETNGTMKVKLFDRLQQGLLLARHYPEAPIIVTGGNAKTGITEAYAMSLWLMNEGIGTNRIHLEDQARDTVGNAIRSCKLLEKLGITQVTLVTSASHVRRALANFEEAAVTQGLSLVFAHLAAKDELGVELDEPRERLAIYRDVMRTSGIWAYPGIQR
jgi:vancomycin permeability regulator SanA